MGLFIMPRKGENMAKIEATLKCELNPFNPIPETLQVIDVMISNNQLYEKEILLGIKDAVEARIRRLEQNKEVEPNGKSVRRDNGK